MEQYQHSDHIVVKDYLKDLNTQLEPNAPDRAIQLVNELRVTVERQQRQIRQLETLVEQLRIRIIQK